MAHAMLGPGRAAAAWLVVFVAPATAAVSRADRAALFWLYENLAGSEWTSNVGWAEDGDPCLMNARWVGVGCIDPCDRWRDGPDCTAGRVTALYMTAAGLRGDLGGWTAVGTLTNLTYLDLSLNNVSGTLPTELGMITNLHSLQLQHNQLSGSIPSQLGDINAAGRLGDWYDPYGMRTRSRLDDIQLQHNQLEGSVPSELGVHTELQILDLSSNRLNGTVPAQLTNISSLRTMYLHHNRLSGTLPAMIGDMVEALHYWDSGHNLLSGSLPPSLGNLRRLNRLHLAANRLSGTLPHNLTDMLNLRSLHLQDNNFTGNLPAEIGKMQNLRWLDVYNNSMDGDMPASIADLINLEHFYLANEHLRPVRQKFCGMRMNPRLGKYSWRLVREDYRAMMSTHCDEDEILDTATAFNALPDENWSEG